MGTTTIYSDQLSVHIESLKRWGDKSDRSAQAALRFLEVRKFRSCKRESFLKDSYPKIVIQIQNFPPALKKALNTPWPSAVAELTEKTQYEVRDTFTADEEHRRRLNFVARLVREARFLVEVVERSILRGYELAQNLGKVFAAFINNARTEISWETLASLDVGLGNTTFPPLSLARIRVKAIRQEEEAFAQSGRDFLDYFNNPRQTVNDLEVGDVFEDTEGSDLHLTRAKKREARQRQEEQRKQKEEEDATKTPPRRQGRLELPELTQPLPNLKREDSPDEEYYHKQYEQEIKTLAGEPERLPPWKRPPLSKKEDPEGRGFKKVRLKRSRRTKDWNQIVPESSSDARVLTHEEAISANAEDPYAVSPQGLPIPDRLVSHTSLRTPEKRETFRWPVKEKPSPPLEVAAETEDLAKGPIVLACSVAEPERDQKLDKMSTDLRKAIWSDAETDIAEIKDNGVDTDTEPEGRAATRTCILDSFDGLPHPFWGVEVEQSSWVSIPNPQKLEPEQKVLRLLSLLRHDVLSLFNSVGLFRHYKAFLKHGLPPQALFELFDNSKSDDLTLEHKPTMQRTRTMPSTLHTMILLEPSSPIFPPSGAQYPRSSTSPVDNSDNVSLNVPSGTSSSVSPRTPSRPSSRMAQPWTPSRRSRPSSPSPHSFRAASETPQSHLKKRAIIRRRRRNAIPDEVKRHLAELDHSDSSSVVRSRRRLSRRRDHARQIRLSSIGYEGGGKVGPHCLGDDYEDESGATSEGSVDPRWIPCPVDPQFRNVYTSQIKLVARRHKPSLTALSQEERAFIVKKHGNERTKLNHRRGRRDATQSQRVREDGAEWKRFHQIRQVRPEALWHAPPRETIKTYPPIKLPGCKKDGPTALPWPACLAALFRGPLQSDAIHESMMRALFTSAHHSEGSLSVNPRTRNLKIWVSGYMLPHDEKRYRFGDDAWFASEPLMSFGVCDGVGEISDKEWRVAGFSCRAFGEDILRGAKLRLQDVRSAGERGLPGVKPRLVVAPGSTRKQGQFVKTAFEVKSDSSEPSLMALDAMVAGFFSKRTSWGAATCLIGCLNDSGTHIGFANIGDSRAVILRRSSVGTGPLEIVGNTEPEQHDWNLPVQLSRLPTKPRIRSMKGDYRLGNIVRALENTQNKNEPVDVPESATLSDWRLQEGDLVLLASDGVWDNLFDAEIKALCGAALSPFESKKVSNSYFNSTAPRDIAKAICLSAYWKCLHNSVLTPFSVSLRESGQERNAVGGKPDDISVVAAWVVSGECENNDELMRHCKDERKLHRLSRKC